ncbi:MAG: hypothetical protein N3H30_01005 [Candidatus Micrarchaeota archaeon]|nr:hypothetical protein [Candidatus Micrarchaeota archaeon]
MRVWLAFALALITFGIASAEGGIPFNFNDPATWVPIASVVVIIHLTLVSIIYMLASTFQDEQLKAWGKNEVMQAVFSAVIIASIGATIAIFDNEIIQPFFAGVVSPECDASTDPLCHQVRTDLKYTPSSNRWAEGPEGAHIVVENGKVICKGLDSCDPKFLMARSYLGITYEKLARVLKQCIRDYAVYMSVDGIGFNMGMTFLQQEIGFNFGGGFPTHGVLMNTLDHLISLIERLMMLIKFQESVLKFFEYGLAASLIVIGIFFRSIWIFRKAGGLFIAMGIGFMFVLPTLYALGWYTIDIPPLAEISRAGGIAEIDIPPLAEIPRAGGIAEFEEMGELGTNSESGVESAANTAGKMADLNAIQAVVAAALMAGFITLMVFEIVKLGMAVAIKSVLNSVILASMLAALISLAFVNLTDADDLYTKGDRIGLLDTISRYAIVAIALPLLNFYITFSFIRGMSPLFGGDAEIPGLSRFL